MSRYRCPTCDELRDEPRCIPCNRRQLQPIDELSEALEVEELPASAAAAAYEEPLPAEPQSAPQAEPAEPDRKAQVETEPGGDAEALSEAEPEEREAASSAAAGPRPEDERPRPGTSRRRRSLGEPRVLLQGIRQLQEYIEDGYQVVLVAGAPGAGKTQLLASFEENRARLRSGAFLDRFKRQADGRVLATIPGEIHCYPIALGGRKMIFVDASGEHFESLYPDLESEGRIGSEELEFLKVLAGRLCGAVLLMDLRSLSNPSAADRQTDILNWILMLLRWLEFEGQVAAGSVLPFHQIVDSSVRRMRQRLPYPVTVLFSHADEMYGQALEDGRKLFPAGERPFFFAYGHLPRLAQSLETHADHFRFDFIHSIKTRMGQIVDKRPCGVNLALEWMLQPSSAAWKRTLPTRHWIRLQRALDRLTLRSRRWRRGRGG